MQTTMELSGLEKASVLLESLGGAASAEILKHLSPRERDLLGAHIVGMKPVKSVTKERVLDEVANLIRHKKHLETGSGREAPLKWLERLDPMEVAQTLADERPHNIALVMAHLAPGAAANVLSHLPEKKRDIVLGRLAAMGPVSKEAVVAVDELLRGRKLKDWERPKSERLGSEPVDTDIPESRPEALSLKSPEDLVSLADEQIHDVLGRLDMADVTLVMSMASDELKSAILRNLPEHTAELINANSQGQFQVKVREIEAAEKRIVLVMRSFAEEAGL